MGVIRCQRVPSAIHQWPLAYLAMTIVMSLFGSGVAVSGSTPVAAYDESAKSAATLLLTHHVINHGAGQASEDDLEIYINGKIGVWNRVQQLDSGTHKLVISAIDGYQHSQWKGDCAPDGSISLTPGQIATCEIVSNDHGARIVIDKSMNDDSAKFGDVVTFSIHVSNLGPDIASSVNVVDVVVSGLEYLPGSMFGAGRLSEEDPYDAGLKWTIDRLSVGQRVKLTFDAKVL